MRHSGATPTGPAYWPDRLAPPPESRGSGFASIGPRVGADPSDAPRNDDQNVHAPGKSRMRLATMPSITSEVPPSIELALVRSQARGRAPPLERSLSHSSASMPPADIRIS